MHRGSYGQPIGKEECKNEEDKCLMKESISNLSWVSVLVGNSTSSVHMKLIKEENEQREGILDHFCFALLESLACPCTVDVHPPCY